jgi:hypothetical protein
MGGALSMSMRRDVRCETRIRGQEIPSLTCSAGGQAARGARIWPSAYSTSAAARCSGNARRLVAAASATSARVVGDKSMNATCREDQ